MKCAGDARSITMAMATQQLLIEMGEKSGLVGVGLVGGRGQRRNGGDLASVA